MSKRVDIGRTDIVKGTGLADPEIKERGEQLVGLYSFAVYCDFALVPG